MRYSKKRKNHRELMRNEKRAPAAVEIYCKGAVFL